MNTDTMNMLTVNNAPGFWQRFLRKAVIAALIFIILMSVCAVALQCTGVNIVIDDIPRPLHGVGDMFVAGAIVAFILCVGILIMVGATLFTIIALAVLAILAIICLVSALTPLVLPLAILVGLVMWLRKR